TPGGASFDAARVMTVVAGRIATISAGNRLLFFIACAPPAWHRGASRREVPINSGWRRAPRGNSNQSAAERLPQSGGGGRDEIFRTRWAAPGGRGSGLRPGSK